jgi:hypothetical protein
MREGYVRRFGDHWIASERQKVEGKRFLGHSAYLASKDKGENTLINN